MRSGERRPAPSVLRPDGQLIPARIEELEAALRKIETLELDPRNSGQMWVEALRQIARKALGEKKDD
jgi:hypothetical protein